LKHNNTLKCVPAKKRPPPDVLDARPLAKALYGINMGPDLKISIIIGCALGGVLSLSGFIPDSYEMFWAIIVCIIFGPITVWKVRTRPNIYALLISLIAWFILMLLFGLENAFTYLMGVIWIYGIISVQLSMALETSFDNVLFIISKFRRRK